MQISGTLIGELDKRFYVRGITITYNCPNCNKEHTFNGDKDDYLFSYPHSNVPESVNWYCNHCEHEWEEKFMIKIEVIHCDSTT